MLYWTLVVAAGLLFTLILVILSGRGYSVEDAEAHSTEYGGIVKEGHGGMAAFLWIAYISMVVWMIVYFVQSAHEFGVVGAG